ncbi:SAM-dependent methyltransferase [Runella slithyformis]|uniref:Uroporphyrin-III C/tetrapyrrole (Corrin/Porphyrin) methyltransferase n=1 Tax=Runella slithyformis (strain ATCC 29530 / DSM 19594 / LMG 11500 / NCIMB 11436 / LSU 4) TaxID=761193 RepID=A0A7U3ZMR6_RUNSL|nr:SAM-dependent methyltransferase [Runella slithyformis]AEI50070.1 Uroporphyrin-III C/tetrapyrrole (Corrin/Porphyrin) methyltransferase [Runella slithyformis DSM 19594]
MKLYLIPTPLADDTSADVLSAQVPETVKELEVFFAENLRSARRFIGGLKLGKVIDDLTFYDLNKETPEAETLAQLKALMKEGKNAGILSEAGCPGVADPGAIAVKLAHQLNIEVIPLVGPSSLLLALMASGLSGQSFVFHGYLPIERTQRVKTIKYLEKEAMARKQTQLFIETPYRNNQVMEDLLLHCELTTRLCIACNLTAPDGFVKTLSIKDWKTKTYDLHRKPTVFLIG